MVPGQDIIYLPSQEGAKGSDEVPTESRRCQAKRSVTYRVKTVPGEEISYLPSQEGAWPRRRGTSGSRAARCRCSRTARPLM